MGEFDSFVKRLKGNIADWSLERFLDFMKWSIENSRDGLLKLPALRGYYSTFAVGDSDKKLTKSAK